MAIAIGSYIWGVLRKKIAVVEVGSRYGLRDMALAYLGAEMDEGFSMFGVDYFYMGDASRLPWIYSKDYEYIVVDFGWEYERYMDEIMRCSLKLIMGSVNLWRYGDYIKLCRYIRTIPGSDRWFHLVGGESEDVIEHLKKESLPGLERVIIRNPFIVENAQLEFFNKII